MIGGNQHDNYDFVYYQRKKSKLQKKKKKQTKKRYHVIYRKCSADNVHNEWEPVYDSSMQDDSPVNLKIEVKS